MKILRSFPRDIPPNRSFVDDEFERLPVNLYDHWQLGTYNEDILMLEWDIAVSPEDLETFCRFIFANGTDKVCVAPYYLYPKSTGLPAKVWCHRKVIGPAPPFNATPWVNEDDKVCNLFSFGMTYFPQEVVKAYLKEPTWQPHDRRLTDTNFSMWHYVRVAKEVPICWDVRPVHLNYDYGRKFDGS